MGGAGTGWDCAGSRGPGLVGDRWGRQPGAFGSLGLADGAGRHLACLVPPGGRKGLPITRVAR
jgi:hypothetical protein